GGGGGGRGGGWPRGPGRAGPTAARHRRRPRRGPGRAGTPAEAGSAARRPVARGLGARSRRGQLQRPRVEAGPVAGVARTLGLIHLDEHGVAVTVEGHGDDPLHVAGGLALNPVLPSAARPVGAPPGGQRAVQCLVVHPGQHEHLAGVVLLGDGGEQPVHVALGPCGDRGVQRRRPAGVVGHASASYRHSPDPTSGRRTGRQAYHRGVSYARDERTALCALLDKTGPGAPTLCDGWRTVDLAAHLVRRERRPDAAAGLMGGREGPHGRVTEMLSSRTPFPHLVQLIRTGPPALSVYRLPGMEERLNLVEFFVHHEDVRRGADGWQPRDLSNGLSDALWHRLSASKLLFRRSPVGVELARGGLSERGGERQVRRTARARTPVVTVTGHPAELILWALGRTGAAQVRLDGNTDAVRQLSTARRGL